MQEKDFYKILGVQRDASDDEIKRAYRKLAHEFHPDKRGGDRGAEEKFKAINEAYGTLKDPEKRLRYDRFGYAGVGAGGFREAGYGADFHDFFSDVFSDFFGTRRRPRPQQGADLRYDLEIGFEEAAFGTDKKIKIPRSVQCSKCGGSGARPGTSPVACPTCNGMGQVRYQQGFLSISRTCTACSGAGEVIKDPCTNCGGTGRSKKTRPISVKIPPGVNTGARLRLGGEGEYGERGGPPGDLYIIITVKPHPIFKREDDDIICTVPISFTQAALGTSIEVPSLDGPVKVKVPPGTQSGKVLRLRYKGIPSVHTGRRGDELVVVKIETPTKLNKTQRELLEEFARISGDDTMPEKKNFFDKVKELFG
jgi:molecular chaperone DnaJ